MATSEGDSVLYSDLNNWYTALNSLARNYSNGIATVTKPSSGSHVCATHINTLHSLITRFRSDKYLGTVSAYWPAGTNVIVGTVIRSSEITRSITRAYANASRIKCKNTARNNYGRHSSTCGSGKNRVSCQHGYRGNGGCYNGYSQFTRFSCGKNGNGSHSSGTLQCGRDSCGTKSCGTTIDVTNSSATKSKS